MPDETITDSPDSPAEEPETEEAVDPEEGDETQTDDNPDDHTGEDPEDEEGEAEKGHSPAFQKLLDKYGGDEEALVNAYFEQANSTSRLYAELEEIKQHLLNDEPDEDVDAILADDPDVKGYNTELESLDNEVQAIQQEQMHLVGQYGQVEQDIKLLEAEMNRADDTYEKNTIKQAIASKKSEMSRLMSTISAGRRELNRVGRDKRNYERQLERAKREVLNKRDEAKREKLRSAQVARVTRDEFNRSMRTEAEKYGVSPDSQQFMVLSTAIRTQIHEHLSKLPKNAPGINVQAAVQKFMKDFADGMGLKTSFRQSTEKVMKRTPVTSGPKAPTPPKGVREPKLPKDIPQTDKTGKYWSPQYAKKRAQALFGD